MADREEILVKNIHNALDQAQRFVIVGIVSAGLSALISNNAPDLLKTGEKVEVPFFAKVSPGIAFLILFPAFIFSACFAYSAITRARKIIAEISDKEIANAALTHFSLFSMESVALRVLAVLLAPGIIFVALLVERSRMPEPMSIPVLLVGAAVYFLPYYFLLYQAIIPLTKKDSDVAPNSDT